MSEVRRERMFPDQLEAALAASPVIYFVYGLCEPYGPQNPVGLDALKAHAICVKAAQTYGGIVAPPHYWHIHEVSLYASWAAEWVGEARPWLTAVPPWIHLKNVCYPLRAADALGFQARIWLCGERRLFAAPFHRSHAAICGWLHGSRTAIHRQRRTDRGLQLHRCV
jgi:creatinine amidohydrolase